MEGGSTRRAFFIYKHREPCHVSSGDRWRVGCGLRFHSDLGPVAAARERGRDGGRRRRGNELLGPAESCRVSCSTPEKRNAESGGASGVCVRTCNSERAVLRSRRWFHLSALYYTEQDKDIHAEQTELPRRTTGERPPHAPHTAARRIHSEGRPARTQRTTGLLLTLTATATVGVQQRLAAPPRPLEDASRPPVGPYRQRRRSRLPPQPTLAAAQSSPRKQS